MKDNHNPVTPGEQSGHQRRGDSQPISGCFFAAEVDSERTGAKCLAVPISGVLRVVWVTASQVLHGETSKRLKPSL
ncbi:MAG: hypothetical protein KME18_18200 [Phormidium tanganyikae FI6-MK23]|nr:hypothetical protein [Phormidium tanganyikae FI6-MK23]